MRIPDSNTKCTAGRRVRPVGATRGEKPFPVGAVRRSLRAATDERRREGRAPFLLVGPEQTRGKKEGIGRISVCWV